MKKMVLFGLGLSLSLGFSYLKGAIHLAAEGGDAAAVQREIDGGADPNDTTPVDLETPMHAAARGGHIAVARVLLRAGGRADMPDAMGRNPIAIAKEAGHVAFVRFLQEYKGLSLLEMSARDGGAKLIQKFGAIRDKARAELDGWEIAAMQKDAIWKEYNDMVEAELLFIRQRQAVPFGVGWR